jgi:methyl-accepting chemotaxis protein
LALTLAGLLVLCFAALMQLKDTMLGRSQAKTRNLVEVALGTLAYHHKLAEDGKLSMDAAKSSARESLRGLRYETSDYFFIIDTNSTYVLMPPKPESEGKNAAEVRTPTAN